LANEPSKNRKTHRSCLARTVTVVAITAALGLPARSQHSKNREISFESSRIFGFILVKAEANGKPALLIVDTGSNHTILSAELIGLPVRTAQNAVSTSKGSGLTGTGRFAIATLKLGSITWRNQTVVVMEMGDVSKSVGQKVDGLLGIDFLRESQWVGVDWVTHRLIFTP